MSYDGALGPLFEEIPEASMSFSPDGKRFAYVARSGQENVAMVDGKEVARFPLATNSFVGNSGVWPRLTPNSRHFYFSVGTGARARHSVRFYFDGQPERPTARRKEKDRRQQTKALTAFRINAIS